MSIDPQKLTDIALEMDSCGTAVVNVAEIDFRREFRDICAINTCKKYGACWMCPPDVGDIDRMIARARSFRHAFVFQSVGELRDIFDTEGTEIILRNHHDIASALRDYASETGQPYLVMGAGYCLNCERCGRADNEQCRHPDKAISSLESHGIAVYQLAELCELDYSFGGNTVAYFGALLY